MLITNIEAARENTPLTTSYDVTFVQQRKAAPIRIKTSDQFNQTQEEAENGPLVVVPNGPESLISINNTGNYTHINTWNAGE